MGSAPGPFFESSSGQERQGKDALRPGMNTCPEKPKTEALRNASGGQTIRTGWL